MIQKVLSLLIKLYKSMVSPYLPCSCRFLPTCSEYALEALQTHSLKNSLILIFRRLCRCHPWGGSGFNPVPSPSSLRNGLHNE